MSSTIKVERTVQRVVNSQTCFHGIKDVDKKFLCVPLDDHYVLECPEGCGYQLNFSPDFAGRFKGEPWKPLITTEYDPAGEFLWRVRTVAYAPIHKIVDTKVVYGSLTPVNYVKTSFHKMQQGE